jgi:hypothetical protein
VAAHDTGRPPAGGRWRVIPDGHFLLHRKIPLHHHRRGQSNALIVEETIHGHAGPLPGLETVGQVAVRGAASCPPSPPARTG